jgi:hypothetical protein
VTSYQLLSHLGNTGEWPQADALLMYLVHRLHARVIETIRATMTKPAAAKPHLDRVCFLFEILNHHLFRALIVLISFFFLMDKNF